MIMSLIKLFKFGLITTQSTRLYNRLISVLSDGSIMECYKYKELVNDILEVTSSYGLTVGDLKFIFELISRDAGDRTIPV